MKKIIRLTENDLTRIVKRVIEEQNSNLDARQQSIFNTVMSLKPKNPSDKNGPLVITNPKNRDNGKTWDDYVNAYKVSFDEVKKLVPKLNGARISNDVLYNILGGNTKYHKKPYDKFSAAGVVTR